MTAASPPAQTFNHVAISVPAALLDADGRASLLDFFGEVFGWTEMPTLTEDGHRLVLRAHSNEVKMSRPVGRATMAAAVRRFNR